MWRAGGTRQHNNGQNDDFIDDYHCRVGVEMDPNGVQTRVLSVLFACIVCNCRLQIYIVYIDVELLDLDLNVPIIEYLLGGYA